MLRLAVPILCLGAAFGPARGAGSAVTPVQKVIELLQDMMVKGQKDKHAEEVAYAKFAQFCTDEIASKKKSIAETTELVEVLAADIGMLESDAAKLGDEIAALQADVEKYNADLKSAKEERAKDEAGYKKEIVDCGEAVDAIERAIVVLNKQNYDRKQATAALMQLTKSPRLPEKAKLMVAAFIELGSSDSEAQPNVEATDKMMPDEQLFYEAPEANAYEFQSGGLIEMLKKLGEQLKEQKTEAEKQNMNSQHAFELMSQDLHDAIENAEADIASKTKDKEEKLAEAATKKKELTAAKSDLEEDTAYLKDLEAECTEKAKSFEEKQQLRAEEIEMLAKAIEIISSAEVSGAAEKHLPTLVQAGTALAQLRNIADASQGNAGIRHKLASFLLSKSQSINSKRLGLLAQQIESSADPFKKVKKMIWDLIQKLMEEANSESEQKGFCDTELGQNKITRDKLSAEIADLTAAVDEMTASIAQMTDELAGLSKDIADLNVAMKDATALREEEKAKNEATIAEAVEAQKALELATTLIKDFYEKAGKATALVQLQRQHVSLDAETPVKMGSPEWNSLANPNAPPLDKGHREGMQTFGETYKGNQDGAGSILAFLEVIMGDFASLEADTKANEAEAQKLYEDFMANSEKAVAVKEKNTEMITNDKVETEASLASSKKDLASNQDALLAANRYYDNLKPTCVGTGITYEERAKRRQEEIVSLQEALKILSGADVPADI